MNIRIDQEFKNLCPPLSKEEYDGLRQDLLGVGLLNPLTVWANPDDDGDPILLDGHNRHNILVSAGMDLGEPTEIGLPTRRDAAQWIIKHQMNRRNLDASQRAMMAAKLANMKAGDNQHTKEDAPNGATSQAQAADVTNVSRRSVQRAAVVLDKGALELVAAVEQGEIKVSTAARVAEILPKTEQAAVMVLPPEERKEVIDNVVHGPAEVSHAISQALLDNNGFKLIQAAVLVAGAELGKAFKDKWIATLNKEKRKAASKMLNELMNTIEEYQSKLETVK